MGLGIRRTFRHRPRERFPIFVTTRAKGNLGHVLALGFANGLGINFLVAAAAQNFDRFDLAFKKRAAQDSRPKAVVRTRFNQQGSTT